MKQTATNDRAELRRLESIVTVGLRAFMDVSHALVEIRERRLFAGTWPRYLAERWNITPKVDWAAPLFDQAEPIDELAGLSPELQRRIVSEPGAGTVDEKMRALVLREWDTIAPQDQAAVINKEEARIVEEAAKLTAAEQRQADLAAIVKALEKARRKAAGVDNDLEEAVAKVLTRARGIR